MMNTPIGDGPLDPPDYWLDDEEESTDEPGDDDD